MTNHFEPLDNGEVLSINETALIFIGHTTFRVGEFAEAVRTQLEQTSGWNEDKDSWFTDTGVPCEVLRFTSGGWQKGKVRIRLEFAADAGEGGDTKESAQAADEEAEPEGESFFVEGGQAIDPLESMNTEAVLDLESSSPEDFADAEINTQNEVLDGSLDSIDDDFNLAPPTPESELATMDENAPFGSGTDYVTSNLDYLETGLSAESADFDPAATDFVLEENPTPELTSLEDADFGTEAADAELVGLEDTDFGLEETPEAPPEISADNNFSGLEDPDFGAGLSLEENTPDSREEFSNLEDVDFGAIDTADTSETELGGLDDLDFGLEETPESATAAREEFSALETANEDGDLGSDLGADFGLIENTDARLSGLDDADFGLESNDLELNNLAMEDFGLEESPDVELSSLGTEEFGEEFSFEPESSPELGGDALDFGEQEATPGAAVATNDITDDFDLSTLDAGALDDADLEVSGFEGAFSESAEADLSGLGEDEFTLESQSLDQEFAGLVDAEFDLEPIASTDFSDLESGLAADPSSNIDLNINSDLGLESFEGQTNQGDQGGDFDSELTNDFIFEADSASEATGLEETDFGLDEFLGGEETGDELESLQISAEDKQEFELAAAGVSQVFEEDFSLDLENFGAGAGADSLSFAGDEELDAIDKQLAEALDDDLDLLGSSTGLTENLFADQEDSLFKDVWDDMNRKVK
ncbi:MAG: hypothetical protein HC916_15330 [Coleofasciculaceae cyanobacterium SM2_1_6]|nr:hypothetical protein [Coleofasciculaceae cyanobacterium SM2_1_6]